MQHAHGKALVLISPNQTKNAQKQALSQGSKQKHTYLMGFCLDPQMGRGVCQPAHGLGVPGVAGDAGPRRPCAGQPADFAYSHYHYPKLASNFKEVKCRVEHPSSLPWPAGQGPSGFHPFRGTSIIAIVARFVSLMARTKWHCIRTFRNCLTRR